MSQPPHENIDVPNPATDTGDHSYPPHSALNQEPRGISDHVDGSGPIFSLYLEMATEEDKKMAENWKDDADGILIFTGLFSAAVASLISVSIQDLQQNPQDTSNFYLANMYQATINPNSSSSLPTLPPPFTPPNYAAWVNALWFLSLVISLTCALLATLLQQWARRYLKVTQPRYSPHKRARIRAFFAEGVDKFLLPWAVEALPTMLHLSLFLFFAGLAVFLWHVHLTIFKFILSWVGLCTALYGCITIIPVFRHDSPYHTPLSLPVWHFVTGIRFLTCRALEEFTSLACFSDQTYGRFIDLTVGYRQSILQGMQKTAEECALSSPPEIDTRAFMWTFDSLDEDHELERFFAGLPGFRSSKVVKDPLPDLTPEQQGKLLIKARRTVICGKAIGPADIPRAIQWALSQIVSVDQYGPVQSAEIARFARGWDDGKDVKTTVMTRAILSSVITRAQHHDDPWFSMAAGEMGVQESVLRNHTTHGNDLSLAILIHVVRQQFIHLQEQHWPQYEFVTVLRAASKFDVLDTSPELQHKFCALWNEVTRGASYLASGCILKPIRNIYLTLHLHTDSAPRHFSASTGDEEVILWQAPSYPLCNIPGHHLNLTSLTVYSTHIQDVSTSPSIPHVVLNDNDALIAVFPPNAPSPSITAPIHVDENPMDVPLLDNMSVPVSSSRAHHTTTESFHDSATSPDPTAAASARDDPSSMRTIPTTTRETSTSAPSVPPPSAVSLQNNADPGLLVHSGAPETPASAPPELVLDDITESTTSPSAPPLPPSAPELDTAEGIPKDSSHEEKGALDPPSVDRAIQGNTVVNLERPPPPPTPTLPSVTDIAISHPSVQGLDAEHVGDSPHASHGKHDIV